MYILCTWVLRMVCTYHYGIFCCVLAWTGTDILSMYIPVWTLPVQNGLILYHSIVHTYHMSSSYNVKTVYIHKHICISSYMYVHVDTCSDHVYTMYIHGMYNFMLLWACISRNRKWHRSRFEPMILCILTSCLDHYTTSVLVKMVIVALYIYILVLPVGHSWRAFWVAGPSQGQLWSSPLGGGDVAALRALCQWR